MAAPCRLPRPRDGANESQTPRSRAAVDPAPFDLEDHVTGIWYVVGFVIAGTLFVFGTIGLAWLISHRTRGDEHKGYPYESGIDTYGDTHARFGISFYIYALMFVAFDIEVIFIFLWALIFQSTPADQLVGLFATMLVFVGILLFGLAYAWRKGVLTWR
jgi:NADH:ubiquinone oxidoreductase subunit 3 (subunit A)